MTPSETATPFDTAVLDVDGTLVDSTYAHVWSWREAFRLCDVGIATWQLHRAIGMGGDKLVAAVSNPEVERDRGDELRARQLEIYRELSKHLACTRGAPDLLAALKRHGLQVVLASSGSREATDDAVALLGAQRLLDATVTADDTDTTKPDTEPVERAVEAVGGTRALVVGDSVWDMRSARRAGHTPIGLLSGGIAQAELVEAGAARVYDDPAALEAALSDVLTAARPPQ